MCTFEKTLNNFCDVSQNSRFEYRDIRWHLNTTSVIYDYDYEGPMEFFSSDVVFTQLQTNSSYTGAAIYRDMALDIYIQLQEITKRQKIF